MRVEDFAASAVDCQGFRSSGFVERFCLEGFQVSGMGGGEYDFVRVVDGPLDERMKPVNGSFPSWVLRRRAVDC